MSRSEVFEEFIKIATEKGLVSEGEAEHTEQNTHNPRWDSLDLSAIEALYGVKPQLSKGMEYEHNIMENAHPNSTVIAPSYDKLNGLVENNNELQAILMHILYKEPENGSPNQFKYPARPTLLYPTPKYASKALMLNLVSVANDMDNKNQDELRILADACIEQMHQGFRKQAILPWLIGAAVGLALVYWQQHGDNKDQGLSDNYRSLMESLASLMSDNVTWGLVGEEYDDSLRQLAGDVQKKLAVFWDAYESIIAEKDIQNGQDLMKYVQSPDGQKATQAVAILPKLVQDMKVALEGMKKEFSNIDYKSRHTKDKGILTSLVDKVPFLHGTTSSLTGDKFDAVINAIDPFLESVQRFQDVDLKQILAAQGKISQDLSESTSTSNVAPPVAPPPPKEKTVEDIDNESATLNGALNSLLGQ